MKTDVDDEEIAPFIQDINRYFEYIDKEELIKKIVSLEFGKFLAYYAEAPEIEEVKPDRKEKKPQTDKQKLQNKAQKGYRRLFINLGKRDGFYPGELMQTLNRFVLLSWRIDADVESLCGRSSGSRTYRSARYHLLFRGS